MSGSQWGIKGSTVDYSTLVSITSLTQTSYLDFSWKICKFKCGKNCSCEINVLTFLKF